MMTPERLAEIKARCDKATARPWFTDHGDTAVTSPVKDGDWDWIVPPAELAEEEGEWYDNLTSDRVFIAHARSDVPDLLAEVEQLKAANKKPREVARIVGPWQDFVAYSGDYLCAFCKIGMRASLAQHKPDCEWVEATKEET